MPSTSYTPQEFLERVGRADHGADEGPLVLSGHARQAEGEASDRFAFAVGPGCTGWTTVPVDVVDSVEVRGSTRCGEETHSLVTVTFKEPQSPEASAYAALLRAGRGTAATSGARRVVSTRAGTPGAGCGCGGAPAAAYHGGLCDFNEYEIDADGTVWHLTKVEQQGDDICIGTYEHD